MICPLMKSDPDPLIALIADVRKRFSEDDLFGGNCGMLAMALVEAAGDRTLRIGMAIREKGSRTPEILSFVKQTSTTSGFNEVTPLLMAGASWICPRVWHGFWTNTEKTNPM
jgi:hypothetical protein